MSTDLDFASECLRVLGLEPSSGGGGDASIDRDEKELTDWERSPQDEISQRVAEILCQVHNQSASPDDKSQKANGDSKQQRRAQIRGRGRGRGIAKGRGRGRGCKREESANTQPKSQQSDHRTSQSQIQE